MHVPAAIRLTAQLNACRLARTSPEVAARSVIGEDVAHHVWDAGSLLGLDPLSSVELDLAMAAALGANPEGWALILPRPGALGTLSGPPQANVQAIEAGAVVVPTGGGAGWLPSQVGPAIQWTLVEFRAPRPSTSPAEATLELREVVLRAETELAEVDMSPAIEPELSELILPPEYGRRSQQTLARSWMLLQACEAGLADDSGVLHSHGLATRTRALTEVRRAATEALCAAVSWPGR